MNLKTSLAFAALTFCLSGSAHAVTMLLKINSPKECPEGLVIESRLSDGMIVFDVVLDEEQVANAGELYRGRVQSNGLLKITSADEPVASVALSGAVGGKAPKTHYGFRLSPAAAKGSELQLGVHLFEKDGTPTLGGGVSMQIHLAKFAPKLDESPEPARVFTAAEVVAEQPTDEVTVRFRVVRAYGISGSVPVGEEPSFGLTAWDDTDATPRFSVLVANQLVKDLKRLGAQPINPAPFFKGHVIEVTGTIKNFEAPSGEADRKPSFQMVVNKLKNLRITE